MKNENEISPQILSSGWGKMEVDTLGRGKDFKLWPGGGKNWDWAEHGTGHNKGIQVEEVSELIANNCTTVILTTGRANRLRVPQKTIETLKSKGIEVIITDTKNGINTYNEYVEKGVRIGGLFHSTC